MSRRANLTITTMASAGVIWPALVLSRTTTAEPAPSPGVPCLDMVQQFAAAPPTVPESLEAASAVLTAFPEQAASVQPVPVADVVEGVSALAAPNPAALVPEAAGAPVASAVAPAPSAPVPAGGAPPVPAVAAPAAPVAEAAAPAAEVAAPVAEAAGVASPPEVPSPEPQPAAEAANVAAPPADAVPAEPVVEVSGVAPPPDGWQSPAAAAAAPVVPTPQLNLPTVPGLPVQLSSEISMPHDLVCEGTAW